MSDPSRKRIIFVTGFLVLSRLEKALSYPLQPKPSSWTRTRCKLLTSRLPKSRSKESSFLFRAHEKLSSGEERSKEKIQFETYSSILDIDAKDWTSCMTDDETASPFTEYTWLQSLEESKCACEETGWIPQHVAIKIDERVCGFVPIYVKTNSMGEFIFDSGWAEAASANGIDYYPKVLVGIPFTPVTGQRILLHPRVKTSKSKVARLRKLVSIYLKEVASKNMFSSVHINFLTEDEATDITRKLDEEDSRATSDGTVGKDFSSIIDQLEHIDTESYLRRTSLQYHWTNVNSRNGGMPYKSFEEYLSCFRSKRRIAIRRERKRVQVEEDIRIDAVVGRDILKYDGLVEQMYQIYLSTVNKMFWGRQYLSLEFFRLLASSDFIDNLCFMCARRNSTGETLKATDVFAGTFNIVKNGVFYGRYWGCLEEVKNLHFETCYWAAIEYCIRNGLKRMEPGAGGGGK